MNVIIITLDACRFDHTGIGGYHRKTTPNLDKIGESSCTFLNNYVVIPVSDPGLISIFTGVFPHTHNIRDHIEYLQSKEPLEMKTLPGVLKSLRYKTGFMSIEQNDNFAINNDFDDYNKLNWRIKNKIKRSVFKIINKKIGVSEATADTAISWVKKHKNNNFFLYVNFMETHWPYEPPEPFDNIFDPEYKGSHKFNNLDYGNIKRGDMIFNNPLTEEERNHAVAHYDGALLYMDSHLGRFIDYLRNEGVLDKTILIILSDHGEHLGEKNIYYSHGSSMYQPSVKVPLIIKIPGESGKNINKITQTIDIMPTIFDLLGVNPNLKIAGKSLVPLIKGDGGHREFAYSESGVSHFTQNKRFTIKGIEGKSRMITDGKWKLICFPHPENNIYELYNLEEDKGEENNLVDKEVEIVSKLKIKLNEFINEKKDQGGEEEVELKEKSKKLLKKLGYID
tara:strand:+ start:379 stop:1731 length:1353 start_codon:yes stop_codon:yes gene_type:complete